LTTETAILSDSYSVLSESYSFKSLEDSQRIIGLYCAKEKSAD